MTSRQPELDPEFEWLRGAHRSERAPEALRQRAIAAVSAGRARIDSAPRARRSLLRRGWWGLALAGATGLALGVLHYGVPRFAASQDLLVAPETHRDVVPAFEPSGSPRATLAACKPPLPVSARNLATTDRAARLSGLEAEVFDQQTRCGPLRRRYLLRMPTGGTVAAPLLIVLNPAGQSAEQTPADTRGRFDDLAQRERVVLVYANGSPSLKKDEDEPSNAGVWQIDDGAHPAVDDGAYLQGVVDDLRKRHGLDPSGEVFLAGYGSGAWMALAAAARQPQRYAGVAVFLPSGGDPTSLSKGIASGGRTRVFVQTSSSEDRSVLALRWSVSLGGAPGPVRVRSGLDSDQMDTVSGAVALRLLARGVPDNRFPKPDVAAPVAPADAKLRPSFFDGARVAWDFWHETKP